MTVTCRFVTAHFIRSNLSLKSDGDGFSLEGNNLVEFGAYRWQPVEMGQNSLFLDMVCGGTALMSVWMPLWL